MTGLSKISPPARQRGFTLVEILVAIFIFAMVMATVFGSFQAVFFNSEKIRSADAATEAAQACFDRMVVDLLEVYIAQPPYYKPPGMNVPPTDYRLVADTTVVDGREFSRLRFTSLAHTPMGMNPGEGIAQIVYYVTAAEDGPPELRRSDTLFPYKDIKPGPADPLLCRNVDAFTVELIDHEGKSHPSWNSDNDDFGYATPRAVRIVLSIGRPPDVRKFETTVKLPAFRRPRNP